MEISSSPCRGEAWAAWFCQMCLGLLRKGRRGRAKQGSWFESACVESLLLETAARELSLCFQVLFFLSNTHYADLTSGWRYLNCLTLPTVWFQSLKGWEETETLLRSEHLSGLFFSIVDSCELQNYIYSPKECHGLEVTLLNTVVSAKRSGALDTHSQRWHWACFYFGRQSSGGAHWWMSDCPPVHSLLCSLGWTSSSNLSPTFRLTCGVFHNNSLGSLELGLISPFKRN